MSDSIDQDREAILAVHRKWWSANVGLDIPPMVECFPSGENFSMFNRNSFTYYGVDEVAALWQHFIDIGIPPRLTQTVNINRFEVWGDTALIACELTYRRTEVVRQNWERSDAELLGSKATEIYRRDSGDGTPDWRMWHFHSGPLQPFDEPRPLYGDTLDERGLGGNPYGVTISTTTELSTAQD